MQYAPCTYEKRWVQTRYFFSSNKPSFCTYDKTDGCKPLTIGQTVRSLLLVVETIWNRAVSCLNYIISDRVAICPIGIISDFWLPAYLFFHCKTSFAPTVSKSQLSSSSTFFCVFSSISAPIKAFLK